MSDDVLEQLISSYMATSQTQYVFGWQGGEPTLMGVEFFRKVVELQQKYGKRGIVVSNGLQTNATLITDELAAHLSKYRFLLGVSLDGPEDIHNRNRVTTSGKGSHADVLKGIGCLKGNNVEFNILVLVNADNVTHGREVYRYLCDMGCFFHQYIPCVEFDESNKLFPYSITGKQWGEFLCEIFDEWRPNDTRKVSIRLFDSILEYLANGLRNVCNMRTNCDSYLLIEYNGDVYPCDFFVEQNLKLGNIMENSWENLQASPTYRGFGKKKSEWNEICDECPYLKLCAGDCPKHRLYDPCNPRACSWLCEGWKIFYAHTLREFKKLAEIIHEQRQSEMMNIKEMFDTLSPQIIKRVGRNDPCPCGSGRKYKKCCGTYT